MDKQLKALSHRAGSLRLLLTLSLSLLLLPIFTFNRVQAVEGELDLSFGTNGKAVATFGERPILNPPHEPHANSRPATLAIQADGKILLAGQNFFTKDLSRTDTDFSLTRHNSDGNVDENFGNLGKITVDFSQGNDSAKALALQADGKILVVGAAQVGQASNPSNNDFGIIRVNGDGSADLTFGQSGRLTTDFSEKSDTALALAVQPDGHFIVAGVSVSDDKKNYLALARYQSDGRLDIGFGTDGKLIREFAGRISIIRFQPDGQILVAGSTTDSDFTLARYQADGRLDMTFGVNGQVTTLFSAPYAIVNDLAFTPQGQIIATGTTGSDPLFIGFADIALVRYNKDGSLDTSFANQGVFNRDLFNQHEIGNALAVQPDGDLIVAGFITPINYYFSFNTGDYLILRFTPDGQLDNRFGDAGAIKTDFGLEDQAFVAGLQKDGRLVVGGYTRRTLIEWRPSDFSLARYYAYTPPDFSLSLAQPSLEVARGQTLDVEVRIQRMGGFAKPVTLAAPDVSALKIRVMPQTILTADSSAGFTLKIKKAPLGTYPLTFVAQDETGRQRAVTLNLNIRKN